MSVHESDERSYDDHGWRLLHTHNNRLGRGQNYIIGDEETNGSVRFITRFTGNKIRAKVETRNDDVWNAGRMETGPNTMFLGQNVSIGALGASLEIRSVDESIRSIPLDIPIEDSGTSVPRVLRAFQRLDREIGQTDFSVDTTDTQFLQPTTTSFQGFIFAIYLKVGAVAATSEVMLQVTTGLTPGGDLIYEQFYPASDFPANTEVKLVDNLDLGTFVGEELLLTISSDTAFGLLGNSTPEPWFAVDIQAYLYEESISSPTGTDKFLVHRTTGNIMSDVTGNIMLNDRSRTINGLGNG